MPTTSCVSLRSLGDQHCGRESRHVHLGAQLAHPSIEEDHNHINNTTESDTDTTTVVFVIYITQSQHHVTAARIKYNVSVIYVRLDPVMVIFFFFSLSFSDHLRLLSSKLCPFSFSRPGIGK